MKGGIHCQYQFCARPEKASQRLGPVSPRLKRSPRTLQRVFVRVWCGPILWPFIGREAKVESIPSQASGYSLVHKTDQPAPTVSIFPFSHPQDREGNANSLLTSVWVFFLSFYVATSAAFSFDIHTSKGALGLDFRARMTLHLMSKSLSRTDEIYVYLPTYGERLGDASRRHVGRETLPAILVSPYGTETNRRKFFLQIMCGHLSLQH